LLRDGGIPEVSVPSLFRLGVQQYPQLFRMKKVIICCHLLSIEAICGDYITQNRFRPAELLMTFSQTPNRMGRAYLLLSILFPSRLGTKLRLVLLLNWYPHFLNQSYSLIVIRSRGPSYSLLAVVSDSHRFVPPFCLSFPRCRHYLNDSVTSYQISKTGMRLSSGW